MNIQKNNLNLKINQNTIKTKYKTKYLTNLSLKNISIKNRK
jgi:hypothetical protein